MTTTPTTQRAGRVILSVAVCFHLFIILLAPNGASYPARLLWSVVGPYSSVLGMNFTWNFFSPDPAHTMYLKLTVHFEDDDGTVRRSPEEMYFPESRDEPEFDVSKRRELYAMRYMLLDPRRIENFLGPWICRRRPGASLVHIEMVINSVPQLEIARLRPSEDLNEMSERYNYIDQKYRCAL